jgi:eukaryotic-like serine/threonine-protein kinase
MGSIREGTVVAGKYQIERPLSRGGMGSIWVARHLKLDMLVAVKLMAPALAETAEGRARFEREARAAALIQSPNVAQIHDYGVEHDTPYIVMELLTGEDLGARLHRVRRLPLGAVAAIFTQVAKALRRAHDAGIVHRDLKPANVFLARSDEDEIVKLLDFGIAKLTGTGSAEEATATGLVLGSIHYMSPEQARGVREIDHRSDLWSLAVIAYRAVVGRLPFPGAQMGDVIVKICSEPIPRPSSIAPDLGPDVDHFFARALARDPDDRWQSARDFAAALAQLAGPALAAPLPALAAPPLPTPPPPAFPTPGQATPAPALSFDPRQIAPRPILASRADVEPPTEVQEGRTDPSWLTPPAPGTLGSAHARSLAPPRDPGRALRISLIAAGVAMTLLAVTLLAFRLGDDRPAPSAATTAPASAARLDPRPPSEAPPTVAVPIPSAEPARTVALTPSATASASATPAKSASPASKPRGATGQGGPDKINNTLGF